MIRCRCGVYSNFGLSCSSCRIPYSIIPKNTDKKRDEEEETEEVETESLEELEELSDLEEDDC